MRSFRFSVVHVAAFGALSIMGCADSGGLCPRPVGAFTGNFTMVSGNCANVKSRDLVIDEDKEASMLTTVNSLSHSVMTEVNLSGCTVAVEQSISTAKEKILMAKLKGDLAVDGARALSGRLQYQEFLPDGMTQSCYSEVEVSYTQAGSLAGAATGQQVTFGAAAEAALQSP